jgi:hypothetical protein
MSVDKNIINLLGTFASPTDVTTGATVAGTVQLDLDAKIDLVVGARGFYTGTPDGDLTVNIYSSPDGTNFDTEAFDSLTVSFPASAVDAQKTIDVSSAPKFIRVSVTNADSATVPVWVFATSQMNFPSRGAI